VSAHGLSIKIDKAEVAASYAANLSGSKRAYSFLTTA
jgi:hypothetical protein